MYHLETSPDLRTLEERLSEDLRQISQWADLKKLKIAPAKSQVTLFTPDTHQSRYHPQVHINDTLVPLEKTPKILGVVLDTHFNFSSHAAYIATKVSSRLRILKALAGTSWGHQKETLLLTYKALILPIFNYAAPLWYPNVRDSAMNKLQAKQNIALKVVTGNHTMASLQHVHSETNVLPVAAHLGLLCQQFLANAMRPLHVSHSMVTSPPGPRQMKATLSTQFGPIIAPFLHNGKMPQIAYKRTISSLHSATVLSTIDSLGPNRVLGFPPPPISSSETLLPRPHRCLLSQLRSGFSSYLNTYLHRTQRSLDDLCFECRAEPHSTTHLFAAATNLIVSDLWVRPREVITFLSTLTSFSRLPPLDPPLPLPPPEPPPQ